jgi:N-acetylglucosaminyldiphosphoundecaprenol N-acetyl-beta-D-mannosaminyltransferase
VTYEGVYSGAVLSGATVGVFSRETIEEVLSRKATADVSSREAADVFSNEFIPEAPSWESTTDDLSRDVYCIFGMPIDAIEMPSLLRRIELAAASGSEFLLSTPNLNYLVNSLLDPGFRETLLQSDVCPADGMSIVWLARLIGVPIKDRVAGSDILAALKAARNGQRPLKLFLFGGAEGVAAAASRALNAEPGGVHCVGSLDPGFGSVEELSRDDMINTINSSGADFLVVSLGGKKGQLWLKHNYDRLRIPIRAHLGASLNFQAGTVKRAPRVLQRLGLEWLWRVKEEPHLWKRYWNDGCKLLRLTLTHILPLVVYRLQLKNQRNLEDAIITQIHDDRRVTIRISGPAIDRHVFKFIPALRSAVATKKLIVIDFSKTDAIDSRFLGLLLMLRKVLGSSVADPVFMGLSPELKRIFRLHGAGFLLANDKAE